MNRLTRCVLPSVLTIFSLLASQGKAAEATQPSGGQELRVATAQIAVTRDIDKNVETIGRAIDRAVAEKADVLLTPEGSLSGYTPKFDQLHVERALRKLVDRLRVLERKGVVPVADLAAYQQQEWQQK